MIANDVTNNSRNTRNEKTSKIIKLLISELKHMGYPRKDSRLESGSQGLVDMLISINSNTNGTFRLAQSKCIQQIDTAQKVHKLILELVISQDS